jgi:ubiquinone/menaquinone biosynthesis C-methylase UbiE
MNEQVQQYWEAVPCGTEPHIVGGREQGSKDWFEAVENFRYSQEPFIHSMAQFTRFRGKRVLEVGVGAGTDHLQWARAGADLYGVDLTNAGITTTRKRLEVYGLTSNLRQIDAEALPFESSFFDVVYSWGVIHHSEHPERIIGEIKRVLKPGGLFIGMLYNRASITVGIFWLKHALLAGKPFRSLQNVLHNNIESVGTKAYTQKELGRMFSGFASLHITPFLSHSDYQHFPKSWRNVLPSALAFYLGIQARR